VITEDSMHLQGIVPEITKIEEELSGLKNTLGDSSELMDQLVLLSGEKVDHNRKIMNAFFSNGKPAAEKIINTNRGKEIRDSITNTINQLSMNRQIQLSGLTSSINTNGSRAQNWGIILAIIACVSCIITFWYLIVEGQKQQRMIEHTCFCRY